MNNLQRIGGLSAVLFGVTLLAATILLVPPFVNMPPDAYQAENVTARLAFAASLGTGARAMTVTGFALQILAAPLILPALLALYTLLRGSQPVHALLALACSALGPIFLLLMYMGGFVFLATATGFGAAGPEEQVARAAAYAAHERFSAVSEAVSWWFFGIGLVLFAFAMRRAGFPRWLVLFGGILGALGALAALGTLVASQPVPLLALPGLLLNIWAIAIGIALYRLKPRQ